MISLKNEPLDKYTTIRIGGPADIMLIPENQAELIEAIQKCRLESIPYKILGNGSNLLVDDRGVRGVVINNTKACVDLEFKNGIVFAGSSVKIQAFIRYCINNDLKGYEYLFSVPASVGGAIFMNAGEGRQFNRQISDYLISVRVFDGENIIDVSKRDCQFSYRSSVFSIKRDWVILGAYFELPHQPKEFGEQKIKERLNFSKEVQDYLLPSAGSVFCMAYHPIFKWVKGLRIGDAAYSKKTMNWISNMGHARCSEVLLLIKIVEILNTLKFSKTKREIEYWN